MEPLVISGGLGWTVEEDMLRKCGLEKKGRGSSTSIGSVALGQGVAVGTRSPTLSPSYALTGILGPASVRMKKV